MRIIFAIIIFERGLCIGTSDTVRFGVAKDLITPAEKTTIMGFGTVFGVPFTDIHDDLYVRALVLEQADKKIILLAFDLCFHDDSLTEALRDYAEKTYGVDRGGLHVSYTHTHYGPAVKGYDITHHKASYEAFISDRARRAIDRAFLSMRDGTLSYGAVEGDWNVSRRKMENGVCEFKPNPDGGRDKNIYCLKLSDTNGKMRALLMNYACHPSNLNAYITISSEYPGRLCQFIEAEHYGCTALFFQGCGGDAKLKIGMKSAERFTSISYEDCDEAAASMAKRINGALYGGQFTQIDVSLDSRAFKIPMPLDVYPKSFFEKERETHKNSSELLYICAGYVLEHYDEMPDFVSLNCGAIKLNGNLYIFSMGGEPSYDVKRVLADMMGDKNMLFFGFNDSLSYVPSDTMLKEGGYEAERFVTEYRFKGNYRPGIDKLFTEYFKRAVDEMK